MVVPGSGRCVGRWDYFDAFDAELHHDVLADVGAALRRDDEHFRAVGRLRSRRAWRCRRLRERSAAEQGKSEYDEGCMTHDAVSCRGDMAIIRRSCGNLHAPAFAPICLL